jgi:hypothetical protein
MPIQRYHQRLKVKAGEQWNINRENFTGTRGWDEGTKNTGGSWFNVAHNTASGCGQNPDGRGVKNGKDWFGSGADCSLQRRASSKSVASKAASAKIAKIPLALSSHIARVYKPKDLAA